MTTLEERVASMPRLTPFRPAAACALALVLVLFPAAFAVAKGPVAQLRVIGGGGRVLVEGAFGATGAVPVRTNPRATCFGAGTGGSGKVATVKGATALGILLGAAKHTRALQPVQVTDAFSFGLGLCGVGGVKAGKKASWYLKVDHLTPQLGGDAAKVEAGDEVLWALAPYPYPDELSLRARHEAVAGVPFGVRVFAYDDKGRRKPAAGVRVTGAGSPTGADGRTTVTLAGPRRLIARSGADIPSSRVAVCVGGKCPRG
jgi:hypothetical protein